MVWHKPHHDGAPGASRRHANDPFENPMEVQEEWVEALICDHPAVARRILEEADEMKRHYLLHGSYLSESPTLEKIYRDSRLQLLGFRINRPWMQVIAFGSFQVMRVFLEYNVEVELLDWNNNSIFHTLVYLCYLDFEKEKQFVEIYERVTTMLHRNVVRRLLRTENKSHKRPLELAAHMGAFQMFKSIFDTKGIYLVKTEVFMTLYQVHWYDITEYESCYPGNRFNHCPLMYLIFINSDRLDAATESKVYTLDPFRDWIQKKCKVLSPIIWAWVYLRLLFLVIFLVHDFTDPKQAHYRQPNQPNTSMSSNLPTPCPYDYFSISTTSHRILMVYLMGHSFAILIHDIIEFVIVTFISNTIQVAQLPGRRKEYVVHYMLYRLNQFILMGSVFASVLIETLEEADIDIDIGNVAKHLLYSAQCIFLMWSMLYFLQLIPFMGYFVISIQRMMGDMFRFLILFVAVLFTFAVMFQRIARDDANCIEHFSNIGFTIYNTFTVMLNMIDFFEDKGNDFFSTALVHSFFVFIVAILMLNFLIALFSQTVNDVTINRDAIVTIQYLSIYWTMEYRLGRLLANRFFRKLVKRVYYTKDDRIYITRVEVRCGQPLKSILMRNDE